MTGTNRDEAQLTEDPFQTSPWHASNEHSASPMNSGTPAVTQAFEHLSQSLAEIEQDETGLDAASEPANVTQPFTSSFAFEDESEGEDDIASYMSDLLRRSNGFSSEPEVATAPTPSAAPGVSEKPKRDYVQKSAPETANDLSNMRQLANANAHTAIEVHEGRQLIQQMYSKLGIAVTALIFSFILLGQTQSVTTVFFAGAVVSSLVATAWTLQFLTMARKLRQLRREFQNNTDADTPAAQDDQPQPVA